MLSHICEEKKFFEFTESAGTFNVPELTVPVHVNVTAHTSGHDYKLDGTIDTELNLICDRCLTSNPVKVHEEFSIIFSTQSESDDSHIFPLSEQDVKIDLTDYITDTLLLNIPMKHVCRKDCKGLCNICGTNLNINTCNCHKNAVDPRWDKLKELKKSLETSEE